MANDFGDFASLVPKGGSDLSGDFGDFASLVPEKSTRISPIAETEGKAALMYPTGKRRPVPEGDGIDTTKVAEAVFGKGTPQEAPLGERFGKIAETGLGAGALAAGAKVASPYLITGGEALMKAPGLPAKTLGAGMVAGGTLAQKIGPREVGAITGAAGAGETAEQILSMAGVPREFQVLGGGVSTGLAQLALEYPKVVSDYLVKGVRGTIPSMLRGLGIDIKTTAEESASKLRKDAIEKAKKDLLDGSSQEASKTIDTALKTGIGERQKAKQAEAFLNEAADKARIQQLQKVKQQQLEAQQKAIVSYTDEEKIGSQIQGEIFATQKPIIEQRATEYKTLLDDAFNSARQKQQSGEYWQTSNGGQRVQQYWQNRIDKGEFTKSQETEIKGILDDIYRGGAEGKPKDINAIDSWIRVLGDKASYGLEPEGAKALSSAQAREIRKSLTEGVNGKGGVYDWEPKFGQAKGLYSEKSSLLKAWDTKAGKKVLSEETKGIDVPKQFFNSREGYDNLVKQLGGDTAKAQEYASEYAASKLQGKTPEQINKWLSEPKNGWVEKVPGLREQLLSGTRGAEAVKRIETIIPRIEARQKTWSEGVDKWAKDQYQSIFGSPEARGGYNPGLAFEKLITSGKPSSTQLKALSTYIGQNPEAKAMVPSAVRNILSKESPKNILITFDDKIAPTLINSSIITKEELSSIRSQAVKIYEADAKDYSIPDNKKTLKAVNFLYGILAQRVSSEATPTPQGQ